MNFFVWEVRRAVCLRYFRLNLDTSRMVRKKFKRAKDQIWGVRGSTPPICMKLSLLKSMTDCRMVE